MARKPIDDGLVHGQGAAALLRSIQEWPKDPAPSPPKRTRRAPIKDPKAAEAYYAEEARRAEASELGADERTIAKDVQAIRANRTKSIINTATRGDEEKQRIATPLAFITALEYRFGTPVDFDLAADEENHKAFGWYGEDNDALKQDWSAIEHTSFHGVIPVVGVRLAFLNPPFANIGPWARKVVDCRWLTRWTVMLVPASYSTDWFLEMRGKVVQDAIPRIQFEGATHLYPKDLTLIVAGFGMVGAGYWDWRASYLTSCRARGAEPEPTHLKGLSRFPLEPVLPDFNWTADPFYKPQAP